MDPHAVIVDAIRTPIGRFGGGLLEQHAPDLAAHLIRTVVERNGLDPAGVGEVILGQVLQGAGGGNVARRAAAMAGLPASACAMTVNKACASGMKALALACQSIRLGESAVVLAGGVESMSNVPFYVTEMRWGHKLGSTPLVDAIMEEGLACPVTGTGMGLTAEAIAERTGITREEMDAWALKSQERAAAAITAGRFEAEIAPVPRKKAFPLASDEHPRQTSAEALAGLRPAFKPDGCVTAGNASGINDGAALALVADRERAQALGWRARATVLGTAMAGAAPDELDVSTALAVRRLCGRLGLAVSDFGLVEINEAFAVQTLSTIRQLGLDEERVNVNGGAIALGHPIGASGARIVTTLLYEMERREVELGLATLCIGGGMGMALALRLER